MGLIREGITTLAGSPIVEFWRLGPSVPDVIGMWAGEPDMPTPPFICEAASKALFEGQTFYAHTRGIP
jgi:aspartate aminotransferase